MTADAEAVGRAILDTIARRLATIALDDPAIRSLVFTVHLRAGGGVPRAIIARVELADDVPETRMPARLDACGPTRKG